MKSTESRIPLQAKTAHGARSEIAKRFPQGATYFGYTESGECVLISSVNPRGEKHHIATASKQGKKSVKYDCEPNTVEKIEAMGGKWCKTCVEKIALYSK